MKKIISTAVLISSAFYFSSCALVTVPVKVAGKVATTGIGIAGKVAGAGAGMITPKKSEEPSGFNDFDSQDESVYPTAP